MHRSMFTIIIAIVSLSAIKSYAQEPSQNRLAVTTELATPSKYVWRGKPINEEQVFQATVQGTMSGVYGGEAYLGLWGNMNLTDFGYPSGTVMRQNKNRFTEYNLWAGFDKAVTDTCNVELGIIFYFYPHDGWHNGNSNTVEYYTKATLLLYRNNATTAQATASLYYDDDEGEGFYGNVGLLGTQSLTAAWTAGSKLSLGAASAPYNSYHYGVNNFAIDELQGELYAEAAISPQSALHVGLCFAHLVDDDIARSVKDDPLLHADNLWLNASLNFTF